MLVGTQNMAWGYWSATALDRGRSPRRNTQCVPLPVNTMPSSEPPLPTATCYSPCQNSRCSSPSCHPQCANNQCQCVDSGDETHLQQQTMEVVRHDSSEVDEVRL